jgi:hypothetical protein
VQGDHRKSDRVRTRRWRDYRTAAGGRPVRDFIAALSDLEAAAVLAQMRDVALRGLAAARHLRGELYELRADTPTRSFRLLFAIEGRPGQVLLFLSSFVKEDPKTPAREFELADREAGDRLALARKLAAMREKKRLSQTVVAARVGTSASIVSKLESDGGVKVSTVQRYCAAIGQRFRVVV